MLKISPKNNTIEFKLEVTNTTLDKVEPRLVVEVDGSTTLLPLRVQEDGTVTGKITLKESWNGKKGTLKLEVINENNYFTPFKKEVIFENTTPPVKSTEPVLKQSQPVRKAKPAVTKHVPILVSATVGLKESQEQTQDLIAEAKNFFKK